MEENESKQEMDYAQDLKIQAKIEEAIELAILQNKETISLDDGKSIIVLRVVMGKERDSYDVFLGNKNLVTVKRDSNGKISYQGYKLDLNKLQNKHNADQIRIVETAKQREQMKLKKQVSKGSEVPKTKQSEALKIEMEQKIKSGKAVQMDSDREVSTTENMRMFVQRAFRVSAQEIYRVQGNDSHSFKYVAKTSNPDKPYEEIDLSHHREGTNSMQKIWIMEDGKLKEKTVDSMLLKGNYAIATDVADNTLTGHTRTYLAARTPNGKYIAIAAGQKQGVHRNTSGNSIQKDFMSRENTVYDLEDVVESAVLAEKIYGFNKDGKLTAKEIEIVRRFKFDKNMDDKEVVNIINAISLLREMGYEHNEIREIIDDVKDAPQSKQATIKLAQNVQNENKKVKSAPESDEQGDEEEYVGYGQKRPH